MSILTVENMSHVFGGRVIYEDVSFKLNKGEHVGFIGANGEGKSTFMKIITNKLMPDEGKIEWAKRVRVGYMDQHAELKKGQTIRDALKTAFDYLFDIEKEMNDIYAKMGDEGADIDKLMESAAELQDILDTSDFYMIDTRVEEVARGVGLTDLGLDSDVDDLSGGQRTKILLAKMLLQNPDILLLDEPTKGLDAEYKQELGGILKKLQSHGITVLMISHDVEFVAEYADRVGLFFEGNIVTENDVNSFFAGNNFYTTAANRMARQYFPYAITGKDVVACLQNGN